MPFIYAAVHLWLALVLFGQATSNTQAATLAIGILIYARVCRFIAQWEAATLLHRDHLNAAILFAMKDSHDSEAFEAYRQEAEILIEGQTKDAMDGRRAANITYIPVAVFAGLKLIYVVFN